ncbi:MAG TPA: hypothetical protein VFS02_12060 [Telluria sp.]|nr:hypothetical protein [Telluria sp.]
MKTLLSHRLAATLAASLLATAQVAAQERPAEPDMSALDLADKATAPAEVARDWHLASEIATVNSTLRNGERVNSQRVSFDLDVDSTIGGGWRGIFSDALDLRRQVQPGERATINTVKEAYLSWQPDAGIAFDMGRINARYGVAVGYNPTDYFRTGANRSIVSIDPVSLKTRRQGSVMLRAQRLWDSGSLTALVSPKLASEPHDGAFDLDVGATNYANRMLIAYSQRVGSFTPQVLLSKEGEHSPQVGLNVTSVLGSAAVAYVEWSGGRSASQLGQALGRPEESVFRSRVASGVTYNAPNKLSLTLEYQHDGGALSREGSEALAPLERLAYRLWVQNRLEMVNRQSWFAYANWPDAMMSNLDFNAMLRQNTDDHSRQGWIEARYHWKRTDLALQWQQQSGTPASEFGAYPQRRSLQALVRYFF